jgi:hypothetical protein
MIYNRGCTNAKVIFVMVESPDCFKLRLLLPAGDYPVRQLVCYEKFLVG